MSRSATDIDRGPPTTIADQKQILSAHGSLGDG